MPPGALALISTKLPYPNAAGKLEQNAVNRYVLDQDTGGAIKGAGRVDVFYGNSEIWRAIARVISTQQENCTIRF